MYVQSYRHAELALASSRRLAHRIRTLACPLADRLAILELTLDLKPRIVTGITGADLLASRHATTLNTHYILFYFGCRYSAPGLGLWAPVAFGYPGTGQAAFRLGTLYPHTSLLHSN